jgi:hypothetical protein
VQSCTYMYHSCLCVAYVQAKFCVELIPDWPKETWSRCSGPNQKCVPKILPCVQVIQDINSNRGRGGYTGKGGDELDRWVAANLFLLIAWDPFMNWWSSKKNVKRKRWGSTRRMRKWTIVHGWRFRYRIYVG